MQHSARRSDDLDGQELPNISGGAISLLAIAQENDKRGQLTTNRALHLSLDLLVEIHELAVKNNTAALCKLLQAKELPVTWFGFCVALANALDLRLQPSVPKQPADWLRTDYDHSVILALGQTLASIVRKEVTDRSTLAAPVAQLIAGLRSSSARDLQLAFVQNYLGNILQDYFDACRVRLTTRGLAPDTELTLRRNDAQQIAQALFSFAPSGPQNTSSEATLATLREILRRYWEKDAASQ